MSIEDEIAELEKHIGKLQESNAQLALVVEESGDDDEFYRSCIAENEALIAKMADKIVTLRALIERTKVAAVLSDEES